MVPGDWANLHLAGQLVFITPIDNVDSVQGFIPTVAKLDLASGALTTLLQPVVDSWTNSVAVSPDGRELALAYAPPPSGSQTQMGVTRLYRMPLDGSAPPRLLLDRADPAEVDFNPLWSPDGKYIYYTHIQHAKNQNSANDFKYTVERLAYPDGSPEVLVENAYWPQLSPDATKLVYVNYDPANSFYRLFVAKADGTQARQIALPPAFPAVDAPFFTPDGKAILFSAISQTTSPARFWLDQLLGAQVASAAGEAHNVPSDWWRIPAAGGHPEQLTHIYDVGLYGNFAPDGKHVAFLSVSGLFVMNPDGTGIASIFQHGTYGTVQWIP